MDNLKSKLDLKRSLQEQQNFIPPFCPYPDCQYHQTPCDKFYCRNGVYQIKRFPYVNQRYRCKGCLRIFCYSRFKLDFKEKQFGLNDPIFSLCVRGISNREIGRLLKVSENLVRGRIAKLMRWILLKQEFYLQELKIDEAIVYDGVENFAYSQFDPNNINQAIGKQSLFVYDFNYSPINRKGRMSERQKQLKSKLEEKHGKYDPRSIRKQTTKILKRLHQKTINKTLVLYSDEHFHYRDSVQIDLKEIHIAHHTTSSKKYRNYKNNLFAVNNFDMLLRHQLAAFKRETIAFSKHPIGMIDKYVLFMGYRNFMRPRFIKEHKTDPEAHLESAAMKIGLTRKILSFKEFFSEKIFPAHVQLNEDWKDYYRRELKCSRQKIVGYHLAI